VAGEEGDALETREDDLDDVGRGLGVDADETPESFSGDDCDGGVDGGSGDDVGVYGGVVAVWGGRKLWR
jgi:hypothetical protein